MPQALGSTQWSRRRSLSPRTTPWICQRSAAKCRAPTVGQGMPGWLARVQGQGTKRWTPCNTREARPAPHMPRLCPRQLDLTTAPLPSTTASSILAAVPPRPRPPWQASCPPPRPSAPPHSPAPRPAAPGASSGAPPASAASPPQAPASGENCYPDCSSPFQRLQAAYPGKPTWHALRACKTPCQCIVSHDVRPTLLVH